MRLIKKLYAYLHDVISKKDERGGYSAGYFPYKIRKKAIELCSSYAGNFLEVGCGEGLFLKQLASCNAKINIYGVDNNISVLNDCHEKLASSGIKNFFLSAQEGSSIAFKDSSFDVVVCINVILNIPSKETLLGLLSELKRTCKKDGRIILEFRNKNDFMNRFRYSLASYYDGTVKSLCLKTYSLDEMSSILSGSGLLIESSVRLRSVFGLFSPIILLVLKKN